MGADFTAYAIIGVKIPGSKAFVVERRRECSHAVDETAAFCPKCGKKVWSTSESLHPCLQLIEDGNEASGLRIVHNTGRHDFWVGYTRVRDEDSVKLPGHPEELESRVRAYLEPHGLWNASLYGMWSVLYCSY